MLQDKPVTECRRCYEIEAAGGVSQRISKNKKFAHHLPVTDLTKQDGTVEKFNMAHIDIRFSNICNLRCRTCGPALSSRWASDAMLLHNNQTGLGAIKLQVNKELFWEQINSFLPTVESIYFAGGEPLIMDEHYKLLKLLIEKNRTDVKLTYNTNFSKLQYKSDSVLDLWNKFDSVTVGASLDEIGVRAEYVRKDIVWQQVLNNKKLLDDACPHVKFFVSLTVSIFNFSRLHNIHRELVESSLVANGDQFNINPLTDPLHYRVHITPDEYRNKIANEYQDYVNFLLATKQINGLSAQQWNMIITYLKGPRCSPDVVERFKAITRKLDKIRDEDFSTTFPELAFLLESPE